MKKLLNVVFLLVIACGCGILDSNQPETNQPDITKPETIHSPIVPSIISARIYQEHQTFPLDTFLHEAIIDNNENHSEWVYYHKYYSVGSHGAGHTKLCTLSVKVQSRWNAATERGFVFSVIDSGSHIATSMFEDPISEPIYESSICTLIVDDTSAVLHGGISSIKDDVLYAILCNPIADSIKEGVHIDSVTYDEKSCIRLTYFGELEIPTNPYVYNAYIQGIGTTNYYAEYDRYHLVSVDGISFDSTKVSLKQSISIQPTVSTPAVECSDISAVDGGVYSVGGGGILFSSDAVTWKLNNVPAGGTPEVLYFLDDTTGWFVSGKFSGRTDDGGRSWKVRDINYPYQNEVVWIKIQFADEQNGYCLARGGQVLATKNGSESWSLLSGGPVGYSSDLSFPDKNNGWVTGSMGPIYHTADAGESWDYFYLPNDTTSINQVMLINFLSTRVGYSVGYYFTKDFSEKIYLLFKTIDGGEKWSPIKNFEAWEITAMLFLDDKIGFLGFIDGTILFTTDSGGSWSAAKVPLAEKVEKIQFSDDQKGWALTSQGKILRTLDAGHNWSYVSFDELITE